MTLCILAKQQEIMHCIIFNATHIKKYVFPLVYFFDILGQMMGKIPEVKNVYA